MQYFHRRYVLKVFTIVMSIYILLVIILAMIGIEGEYLLGGQGAKIVHVNGNLNLKVTTYI